WYLTQMRRWGQISEDKSDDWYQEVAAKVYRPDIYAEAAKSLIAEGLVEPVGFPDFDKEDGYKEPQTTFIDGISYNGREPNAYIDLFPIGLKTGETL
ncbi:MAG: nitrate ABC transporter substrate-binding protein, partial [Pseudomonadota bacterium]